MGFWDVAKKVGRIGIGIGTGGASEVAIGGYNAAKGKGLGDSVFGKVKTATPGDRELYDWGGSPQAAQEMRDYLRARTDAAQGRGAYQLDQSTIDQAMGRFGGAYAENAASLRNEGEARAQQAKALEMYRNAAEGRGESVAAAQMRQGLEESSRMGQNLVAGANGANPLLAASNAAAASADAARRSNTAAAAMRAQEIDQARAGYAGLSSGMRAGDLARGSAALERGNAALGAGQFAFGADQAQGALEMQQRGMNDAYEQAFMQNRLQMERDALAGRTAYGQAQLGASQTNANNSVANRAQNQQAVTDVAKGIYGAAMSGGLG